MNGNNQKERGLVFLIVISNNPLDYITRKDIEDLGLLPDEVINAYQPSSGGVYHARGAEGKGKTLLDAHFYRGLIDTGRSPLDCYGNITFKGKYGRGSTTIKGDYLRAFLWDLTHKPITNVMVFIDEIDSEFPARSFSDLEQTEIALRMWHTHKLGNYIFLTSHIGNSTDLIFHLASHYFLYPQTPDFESNSLLFDVVNILEDEITYGWVVEDIIKTMLIYNRKELTENTEDEQSKIRPSLRTKKRKRKAVAVDEFPEGLDIQAEKFART